MQYIPTKSEHEQLSRLPVNEVKSTPVLSKSQLINFIESKAFPTVVTPPEMPPQQQRKPRSSKRPAKVSKRSRGIRKPRSHASQRSGATHLSGIALADNHIYYR